MDMCRLKHAGVHKRVETFDHKGIALEAHHGSRGELGGGLLDAERRRCGENRGLHRDHECCELVAWAAVGIKV